MEKETTFRTSTDEQLVRRIVRTNDTLLFAELYDRYSQKVYNKCLGFAKSQGEAEDLTQDVFLMLFIKLGSFKGKSKFSSWVYAFTYNFCVNYVNRNKERKMKDKSDSLTDSGKQIAIDVDDEDLLNLRSQKLKKALELIAPEDKKILLLKYQDDIPIKELTRLLDLSDSAVKMRLKRSKARLIEVYNKIP